MSRKLNLKDLFVNSSEHLISVSVVSCLAGIEDDYPEYEIERNATIYFVCFKTTDEVPDHVIIFRKDCDLEKNCVNEYYECADLKDFKEFKPINECQVGGINSTICKIIEIGDQKRAKDKYLKDIVIVDQFQQKITVAVFSDAFEIIKPIQVDKVYEITKLKVTEFNSQKKYVFQKSCVIKESNINVIKKVEIENYTITKLADDYRNMMMNSHYKLKCGDPKITVQVVACVMSIEDIEVGSGIYEGCSSCFKSTPHGSVCRKCGKTETIKIFNPKVRMCEPNNQSCCVDICFFGNKMEKLIGLKVNEFIQNVDNSNHQLQQWIQLNRNTQFLIEVDISRNGTFINLNAKSLRKLGQTEMIPTQILDENNSLL